MSSISSIGTSITNVLYNVSKASFNIISKIAEKAFGPYWEKEGEENPQDDAALHYWDWATQK